MCKLLAPEFAVGQIGGVTPSHCKPDLAAKPSARKNIEPMSKFVQENFETGGRMGEFDFEPAAGVAHYLELARVLLVQTGKAIVNRQTELGGPSPEPRTCRLGIDAENIVLNAGSCNQNAHTPTDH